MKIDFVRFAIVAAVLWYVLADAGPPSSTDYTGPMRDVHAAAASMDAHDRQGLAEALAAAGKMLGDDMAGLLKTTADVQEFTQGTLAYGYSSFSLSKYPQVAQAVQLELEKATGDKIEPVTPEIRSRVADALAEAGRAVQ